MDFDLDPNFFLRSLLSAGIRFMLERAFELWQKVKKKC